MGKRKAPNGFGIAGPLKIPKSFNIQMLRRVSSKFPEMPYRTQQKFLPPPFTQENELNGLVMVHRSEKATAGLLILRLGYDSVELYLDHGYRRRW